MAWARSSAYASASLIRPAATICAAHESSSVSRAGGRGAVVGHPVGAAVADPADGQQARR